MTIENLVAQIHSKESFLCVGLDTDLEKIPKHLLEEEDPIFSFNKAIIDATQEFCVAYKPNIAFMRLMVLKDGSP
jgi:orotidine-5'-phosphate decarboxylase